MNVNYCSKLLCFNFEQLVTKIDLFKSINFFVSIFIQLLWTLCAQVQNVRTSWTRGMEKKCNHVPQKSLLWKHSSSNKNNSITYFLLGCLLLTILTISNTRLSFFFSFEINKKVQIAQNRELKKKWFRVVIYVKLIHTRKLFWYLK
jgi:hypothetical protein